MKIRNHVPAAEPLGATAFYEATVRELMTTDPVTLSPEDSVRTLAELMAWKGIHHVPITDADGRLVGLVSHRDFLAVAVSRLAKIDAKELTDLYSSIKIEAIMGRKVETVAPNLPLHTAAQIMTERHIGCLPVLEHDGTLVGIITQADFVSAFRVKESVTIQSGRAV